MVLLFFILFIYLFYFIFIFLNCRAMECHGFVKHLQQGSITSDEVSSDESSKVINPMFGISEFLEAEPWHSSTRVGII